MLRWFKLNVLVIHLSIEKENDTQKNAQFAYIPECHFWIEQMDILINSLVECVFFARTQMNELDFWNDMKISKVFSLKYIYGCKWCMQNSIAA